MNPSISPSTTLGPGHHNYSHFFRWGNWSTHFISDGIWKPNPDTGSKLKEKKKFWKSFRAQQVPFKFKREESSWFFGELKEPRSEVQANKSSNFSWLDLSLCERLSQYLGFTVKRDHRHQMRKKKKVFELDSQTQIPSHTWTFSSIVSPSATSESAMLRH